MSITQIAENVYEVDTLELIHKGGGVDGFGTHVEIDGKDLRSHLLMWDKTITLIVECDEPVRLIAEVRTKVSKDCTEWAEDKTVEFQTKNFDFTFGDLRITTDPKRMPCKITLGEYEPHVRSVRIKFVEGECPWVDMTFRAYYGDK